MAILEFEFEWEFYAQSASNRHLQGENIQSCNLFSPVSGERHSVNLHDENV